MPDFQGRYVNRERRGARAHARRAGGRGRPVEIFFFGGSSMFGLFQRDEHTIPSEFARLAEADGIHAQDRQLRTARVRELAGAAPDGPARQQREGARPRGLLRRLQRARDAVPARAAPPPDARSRRGRSTPTGLEEPDENAAQKSAAGPALRCVGRRERRAGRRLGISGSAAESGGPVGLAALTPAWPGDQGDRPRRRGRYAECDLRARRGPDPARQRQLRLPRRVLLAAHRSTASGCVPGRGRRWRSGSAPTLTHGGPPPARRAPGSGRRSPTGDALDRRARP